VELWDTLRTTILELRALNVIEDPFDKPYPSGVGTSCLDERRGVFPRHASRDVVLTK